jgi:hypothetical protein
MKVIYDFSKYRIIFSDIEGRGVFPSCGSISWETNSNITNGVDPTELKQDTACDGRICVIEKDDGLHSFLQNVAQLKSNTAIMIAGNGDALLNLIAVVESCETYGKDGVLWNLKKKG